MLVTLKILIETAKEQKIQYRILDPKNNLVEFSQGQRSTIVYKTITDLNSTVASEISAHKSLTSKILQKNGLPVQYQVLCRNQKKAIEVAQKVGFPSVVKPDVGSMGRGVTANITSGEELGKAIQKASACSRHIVISNFYPGEDYRLLILRGKPIGAIKRLPPKITGDGQSKVNKLIAIENQKRESFNQKVGLKAYKKIKIDSETKRHLKKNNLRLTSILDRDQSVVLRSVANCSTGGLSQTLRPSSFHPTILKAAIKATKIIGLNFCGVDFILQDPKAPFEEKNGVILETNSSPGLPPHHYPFSGTPQKIAPKILKALLFFTP